jgi:hypothetical protein
MAKKKEQRVKPKEQPNKNHKEDFLKVLGKAVQPTKQADK